MVRLLMMVSFDINKRVFSSILTEKTQPYDEHLLMPFSVIQTIARCKQEFIPIASRSSTGGEFLHALKAMKAKMGWQLVL